LRLYCSQPNILPESKFAWEPFSVPPTPPSLSLVSPGCLIADSGKLKELDRLLAKLKPEGHRVLLYSQMTKMIDLLEELMLYRGYAYLRLDGSSRLSDRRDMVAQWQTDSRWFVFLLSTRAGGLGINLTAADTVIFYDSDWNPTVDQQAMDRAHRLGQLKPVRVFFLIYPSVPVSFNVSSLSTS
uniref:Chromatin-remodeling ATPase INO80 n=1 Tax=Hydatigena taeniaeformis TaxID=6205 RepID=A0A0R3WXY2_HYDTA